MSGPSKKPRKVRADAKLKTLPADAQQRIADWCMDGTLESARSRCASELGVTISLDAVSKFFAWWKTAQDTAARKETLAELFNRADANAKAVGQMLAERGATAAQIAAADHLVFQLQATKAGEEATALDRENFIELEKLRIARESAETKGRHDAAKLATANRRAAQAERALLVQEAKFRRETCELFLKWSADAKAREVLSSGASNAEKIERLGQQMFGEDWNA